MTAPRWLLWAAGAAIVLAVGLGIATLSETQAQDESAVCGGVTFHDRDLDGERDEPVEQQEAEPALENVRVNVVDRDGAVFERSSGAGETWGMRLRDDQFPIRILFEPPQGYAPTVIGTDSNTAMQIVKSFEDCQRRSQGSLGLYEVERPCEDPELFTSCYVVGYADGHDTATAVLAVSNRTTDNAATEASDASDWMDPLYRPILRSRVFEIGPDELAGRWSDLASVGSQTTIDLGFFEQSDSSNVQLFGAVGVAAVLLGGVSILVRRRRSSGRADEPGPA